MDKKEIAILGQLIPNSRTSLTQLAKNIGLSREVTTYHFNKLVEKKIILDFVTSIDIEKMGFTGAAVFVNVKSGRQAEFEEYLTASPYVSWVAELSGRWNFGLSIFGRNNAEVDDRFHEIYNAFAGDIIDHQFAIHRRTQFFYEKYLGMSSFQSQVFPTVTYTIDEVDKKILKEVAKNSRIEAQTIAHNQNLSTPTVTRRLARLEESGVIEKYSIFLNVRELGLYQHSIFAVNKNVDEKEEMISYLAQHPAVSFIAEYVGDPFIEFGVFTQDPYELRGHVQEIEQHFPHNRTIDILLFQREFVSSGPPLCVFE